MRESWKSNRRHTVEVLLKGWDDITEARLWKLEELLIQMDSFQVNNGTVFITCVCHGPTRSEAVASVRETLTTANIGIEDVTEIPF